MEEDAERNANTAATGPLEQTHLATLRRHRWVVDFNHCGPSGFRLRSTRIATSGDEDAVIVGIVRSVRNCGIDLEEEES